MNSSTASSSGEVGRLASATIRLLEDDGASLVGDAFLLAWTAEAAMLCL